MLGAKQILINVKGDNKNFKTAMAGASTSMKGFATTTASSMAIATAGITIILAGVVALTGALKSAVGAAAEDQEATARTISLLEEQGIAWNDVGDDVLNYIENLERLTLFGDTELQTSFNELIASGMSVDEALAGMSAAAAIANSTEMSLSGATKALGKEFTTGTSRLKDYGIEAENFNDIISQVTDTMGDGGHVTETVAGKYELLKIELGDQAKLIGNSLLPAISSLLESLIWIAKYVIPDLIYAMSLLKLPFITVIGLAKSFIKVLEAGWEALHGNFKKSKELLNESKEILSETWEEMQDVVWQLDRNNDTLDDTNDKLKGNLKIQEDLTDETARTAAAAAAVKAATEWKRSSAGFTARTGALGSSMSASTAYMLYGEDVPGSVTIAPTSGPGAITGGPDVPGFDTQAVSVTINTGDINNQGDVAELGVQVATAVSANRSGI